MAKKTITLQITGPDGARSVATSELESIILGSGPGAAVTLLDPQVSNLHCMLKVEKSGRLTVIDLGSEGGTRLKNQPVRAPAVISSGEILSIGGSRIRVLFGEEPTVVTAPLAAPPPPLPVKRAKVVPTGPGPGRNAAGLFDAPLPAGSEPTQTEKVLQVALLWGDTLLSVQHFAAGVDVTVGDRPGCHFQLSSPTLGPSFTLAQRRGAAITVNVPQGAGLEVSTRSGESRKTREQLQTEGKLKAAAGALRADAVELALHDQAQLTLENVALVIRQVRPSAVVALDTLNEHDFTFFKIVSISLLAFFALVAAMVITPPASGWEGDDIFANPSKYVKMVIKPATQHELARIKEFSGVKAKEKPTFGKPDAKKPEANPSKKGAPVLDANKREEDRKKVSSLMAGMFGGGASSNLFGGGGLGTGINNALGGLQGGAGVGDAQGVAGLGSRGSGSGGGSSGLGLGGLGTRSGRSGGSGGIDLGGHGKDTTRIIPGKTTVIGGLDKEVIMKVIKRHQNEIKFCYEQELQKNPALAGKVAVAWTIDPSGGVSEANVSESTMGNTNVEACIVQRIRRWKFAEPQGGGVVNVTFPWIFKAAGQGGDE